MTARLSWASVKRSVFERDGWTCQLCGAPIDRELPFTDQMSGQIDHIVAVTNGGSDDLANLQAAHRLCNARKGPSQRHRGIRGIRQGQPTGAPIGFFRGVDVDLTPRLAAAVAELAAAVVEQVVAALDGVPGPDRLLDLTEAADRLSLSRTQLYSLIGQGALHTIKVGKRRLVPEQAIAAFISTGQPS